MTFSGITEEFLEKLNKNDLIILDVFVLHLIDEKTRQALLTLLDDRYEKKSVIILHSCPTKWYEYIGQNKSNRIVVACSSILLAI